MSETQTSPSVPINMQVTWITDPSITAIVPVSTFVWTKSLALKKGLAWFAATWGLCLISGFIPLVHFVAVPVLFFLGPFLGYIIFKVHLNQTEFRSDPITCPKCQARIAVIFDDAKPRDGTCLSCQTGFTFEIASPESIHQ